jgi:hypothetical protein
MVDHTLSGGQHKLLMGRPDQMTSQLLKSFVRCNPMPSFSSLWRIQSGECIIIDRKVANHSPHNRQSKKTSSLSSSSASQENKSPQQFHERVVQQVNDFHLCIDKILDPSPAAPAAASLLSLNSSQSSSSSSSSLSFIDKQAVRIIINRAAARTAAPPSL